MTGAAFEIIPAIDVRAGGLSRMPGGDPGALRRLPGDPEDLARDMVEAGARWLHVVDLDAALGGPPRNLRLVAAISRLPVKVQAGGSLTPQAALAALEAGAARAVLGAAILSDPEGLREALGQLGKRAGVALDVRDGRIAPRGSRSVGPPWEEALEAVAAAGPAFVTFTDSGRDGSLTGPDVRMVTMVAERVPAPVYVSGGVASIEDLQVLAAVRPALAGAIVGRALQDGAFTLAEAAGAVSVGPEGLPDVE
jgi:phosphoribosylformimino-5-aminoimidazole carboxamide ribonucleotide (ProFAR) isomerase